MRYWLDTFSTGEATGVDGSKAISTSQQSQIVSLLSAGTFFGSLTSAPVGDLLGRRMGLIASCFVFMFGVILQTAATAIPLFVAGRFFAGFGVGLVSALIPLYQSESAPKWIRGTIVGCYQFAITIGLFIAAIVDYATKDRYDTGSYRIPIAVQFAWGLILIGGMLILPETPRYCIKRGKQAKAAKALSRLRRLDVDHPALVEELAEIQANHEYELSLGTATYLDCFKGTLGKRLATGCLLQGLQQLTGINFIFYYGTSFFTNSGISNPFIITVITDVVNVSRHVIPSSHSLPILHLTLQHPLTPFTAPCPASTWSKSGAAVPCSSGAPWACSSANTLSPSPARRIPTARPRAKSSSPSSASTSSFSPRPGGQSRGKINSNIVLSFGFIT